MCLPAPVQHAVVRVTPHAVQRAEGIQRGVDVLVRHPVVLVDDAAVVAREEPRREIPKSHVSRALRLAFSRRHSAPRALGSLWVFGSFHPRRRVLRLLLVVQRVLRGLLLHRRREADAEIDVLSRVDFRIVDIRGRPRRVARVDGVPRASRFGHGAAEEIGGGDPGSLFRLGFPMRARNRGDASHPAPRGIRLTKEYLQPRANHGGDELEVFRDARDGAVGNAEDGRGREEDVIVLAIPRSGGCVLGVLLLLSRTLLLLLLRLSIGGVRRRRRADGKPRRTTRRARTRFRPGVRVRI